VLPKMAEAVARPLAQTERIVMISTGEDGMGASRLTKDITGIVAQLPHTLEALTGMDLAQMLRNLPGLKGEAQEKEAAE
jgi:flotillin